MIEVDPSTSEIAWQYQGDPPISFYSYHISGAERLPNGNTLICEGTFGRLFEVTPDRQLVWEYINPFFAVPTGQPNAPERNAVFRAFRYSEEEVARARAGVAS